MTPIGPRIGEGNVAEVFAYGANVLKLYATGTPAAVPLAEAAVTAIAAESGLPVPQIFSVGLFSGRWGIEMQRIEGGPLATLAEGRPELAHDVLETMVQLQLRMHARIEPRLPALKPRLADKIARAPGLDATRRQELLARLDDLPEGTSLCHGDFHPFNLVGDANRPTIIDWADATSGPAAADACRSYLILRPVVPDLAEAYLDAYASGAGISRTAILRWLPCLAAARLAEGIAGQESLLLDLATRQ